jgi:hypothetical protein
MAVRIFAAGLVAASLLVAPAFAAQTSSSTSTEMKPAHTETTTTVTDKAVSNTDAHGKTVTHHHKIVKHKHTASKKMAPATDASTTNSMQ